MTGDIFEDLPGLFGDGVPTEDPLVHVNHTPGGEPWFSPARSSNPWAEGYDTWHKGQVARREGVARYRTRWDALDPSVQEAVRNLLPTWTGTWEELLEVASDL